MASNAVSRSCCTSIPPGSRVELTPMSHPTGRLSQTPISVVNALGAPSDPSAEWDVFSASLPQHVYLHSVSCENYLKIDNLVLTVTDERNAAFRQLNVGEGEIVFEAASFPGKYVAMGSSGLPVPPGGVATTTDETTKFTWDRVNLVFPYNDDLKFSSAVFKSAATHLTLTISSTGKVSFKSNPGSKEARINILPQRSAGSYALQCSAYPHLYISAEKRHVFAGELSDFSNFQLYKNKAGQFAFLSIEHQNQKQEKRLFLAAAKSDEHLGVHLSKFIFTNGGIGLLEATERQESSEDEKN